MTLPAASASDRSLPTPAEIAQSYLEAARRASRLLRRYLKKAARKKIRLPSEEVEVARAFMDLSARLLANPYRLAQTQMAMMRDHITLWQQSTLRAMGMPFEAVALPDSDDARFADTAWGSDFLFDFIKQSYLITARHLHEMVARAEGLDAATQLRVQTRTRQFIDALSPTNFALTNPEILRETVDSRGKNLVKALKRLLKDLAKGDGRLLPLPTDALGALRLGSDLAATPGKVVFQNELMQLIQYLPAGSHQYRKPLLIIPPWFTKYYLFDLRRENSFVRWTSEQGFTTFIVSWVDPDPRLAQKDLSDYLVDGVLAAIAAVEEATGEKKIDLVGYSHGGTLLMATLAWMAARRDRRAASATFLASQIDFSRAAGPGTRSAADGAGAAPARRRAAGSANLASACRIRQANDLVWTFVVNHYLRSRERFPIDLFHWSTDLTRTPSELERIYFDDVQRDNRLLRAGGLSLAGVELDVGLVRVPCYFLATIEDHIAPWKRVYRGARLPAGPVRFVLGTSGHVAGTINPPGSGQQAYWSSDLLPDDADDFLGGASRQAGSWWEDWQRWLLAQSDGNSLVTARQPGERTRLVIEDAPGSYASGGHAPQAWR